MIVFLAFFTLAVLTWILPTTRMTASSRSFPDWLVDAVGLTMQGFVIPLLQILLIRDVLDWAFPAWKGSLAISPLFAFALNFLGVDYLYYWNHRLLHHEALWPLHSVHHSAEQVDVFTTGRNTFWTPFFIVYLWINGILSFLLKDPAFFLLGASCTAALDLWRHSSFFPSVGHPFHRAFGALFITPHEHHLHHARPDESLGEKAHANFSANWSVWDRIHGTYRFSDSSPREFGSGEDRSVLGTLFLPRGDKA
jgi:sterol desaturase/sphingolipid hydroxylase (fatty acid hydroxylase superfamily)